MYENRILAERYLMLRVIGSGGQGRVWLAKDLQRMDNAAVKELSTGGEPEAELLKRLRHPRIPRFRSLFHIGNKTFLCMDYIEGQSLSKVLEKRRLSEEEARDLAGQLLNILSYLHHLDPPVLYLDLKPSNLILDNQKQLHLIDLGIACRPFAKNIQALTRGYAAPEQYLAGAVIDERTDLYALGVLLHTCLSGKNPNMPPYVFQPLRTIDPGISRAMEQIVHGLLSPSPRDRFQSAEAVRSALSREGAVVSISKKTVRRALIAIGFPVAAVLVLCFTARSRVQGEAARVDLPAFQEKITFSPAAGTYDTYQLVEVAYDGKRGQLYYTTDGSRPDRTSAAYVDGIVVSHPETTVRVVQIDAAGKETEGEAAYRISCAEEEVALPKEEPLGWDIYFALGKDWEEPVYAHELAEIRSLPTEDVTGENAWILRYLPFFRKTPEGENA